MNVRFVSIVSALLASAALAPSVASAQSWASWALPGACSGPVTGSMGGTSVSYTGSYNGVRDASKATCVAPGSPYGFSEGSRDYFTPSAVYAPTPTNESFIQFVDMVGLNSGGTAYEPFSTSTITFGRAVIDPYIALISVGNVENANGTPNTTVTYNFNSPFEILSYNPAGGAAPYWGNSLGTFDLNTPMTSLSGQEFSGILRFSGTFTSLSFTVDANENWHGMTVGARSIVPEPSSVALMLAALVGMGVAARRRRQR